MRLSIVPIATKPEPERNRTVLTGPDISSILMSAGWSRFVARASTNTVTYGVSPVANHDSAIKRARQNERRRRRNRAERNRLRAERKSFARVAASGDPAAAEHLRGLQKTLAKLAAKGVIHKNRAARLLSRASRKVAPAQ
jgi:small subunit ribosomal protein S20